MRNEIKTACYRINSLNFPPLSAEVLQIQRELNQRYPNTAVLASRISKNPKILSLFIHSCNLLYSDNSNEVKTAKSAVERMGIEEVGSILYSSIILSELSNSITEANFLLKSIKTGMAAAEISYFVYGIERGEAYLAALMSEIGAIVINRIDPGYLAKFHARTETRPFSSEDVFLNHYHATLPVFSAMLSKKWGVEHDVVKAILLQNHTLSKKDDVDAQKISSLIAVINLAKYIRIESEDKSYITDELKKMRKNALSMLGKIPKKYHKAALSAIRAYTSSLSPENLISYHSKESVKSAA